MKKKARGKLILKSLLLVVVLTVAALAPPPVMAVEGQWVVTKEATCTENGQRHRTDGVNTEIEEIPATGHRFDESIVEATCTTLGTLNRTCRNCGYSYAETNAPLKAHNYVETFYQAASCTTPGQREKTCSGCGEKITETIPVVGHTYGDWQMVKEPTATESGFRMRECEICGDQIGEEVGIQQIIKERLIVQPADDVPAGLTPTDKIIIGLDAVWLLLFLLLIKPDISKIRWEKRTRVIAKKEQEQLLLDEDSFGFRYKQK